MTQIWQLVQNFSPTLIENIIKISEIFDDFQEEHEGSGFWIVFLEIFEFVLLKELSQNQVEQIHMQFIDHF